MMTHLAADGHNTATDFVAGHRGLGARNVTRALVEYIATNARYDLTLAGVR